ncbi:hypothetical protein EAH77_07510 [Ewingella americana]|uniref:Uncharacterized protein n=1 Tax=Ewingella americana TaxID=41202 RepID=A0A502GR48_9GAMM|nr:hypothetical protein EAH77_07510 [Ewingella americana]
MSRHRLAGDIFERGRSFFKFKFKFKFKIKICMVFVFKNAWAAFKTTSNKRWKTARGFARVVTRNERTAQRRSLRL